MKKSDSKNDSKKSPAKSATRKRPAGGEVDAFMAALRHPLQAEIAAVRRIILGVSPTIAEGIKWNAPSFRTTEFFATTHLRSRERVQLIFHLGAKVRTNPVELKIADPAGLIQWLAKDRCRVTVGAGNEVGARSAALAEIVRQWIDHV